MKTKQWLFLVGALSSVLILSSCISTLKMMPVDVTPAEPVKCSSACTEPEGSMDCIQRNQSAGQQPLGPVPHS